MDQLPELVTPKRFKITHTPNLTRVGGRARMFQIAYWVRALGGKGNEEEKKNQLARLTRRAVTWKPNEHSFPHLVKRLARRSSTKISFS